MHISKKILFAPLDWGLGHASRCIPLIKECIINRNEVIIAGNQTISDLLKTEFPQLQYLYLPGYDVSYSAKKWALPFLILIQLPKIRKAILAENRWLDRIIEEFQIDLVISDNRYGLHSTKIPCIFITHQLQIQVPQSSIVQEWVNRINHLLIKKFSVCLVPDYEVDKMSGHLSEATGLTNITYIGNLSRFSLTVKSEPLYDLLVLLSGPEPQRSLLEQILLEQIQDSEIKTLIVRGKPGSLDTLTFSNNITVANHLSASDLQTAIVSSAMVICRSGYSTVMDLIKLNKRAILIPTPGQTEQEYLAYYLTEMKWFMTCEQKDISIANLLEQYSSFSFTQFPHWKLEHYKEILNSLLTL